VLLSQRYRCEIESNSDKTNRIFFGRLKSLYWKIFVPGPKMPSGCTSFFRPWVAACNKVCHSHVSQETKNFRFRLFCVWDVCWNSILFPTCISPWSDADHIWAADRSARSQCLHCEQQKYHIDVDNRWSLTDIYNWYCHRLSRLPLFLD
jgi:hypothetical protein